MKDWVRENPDLILTMFICLCAGFVVMQIIK